MATKNCTIIVPNEFKNILNYFDKVFINKITVF